MTFIFKPLFASDISWSNREFTHVSRKYMHNIWGCSSLLHLHVAFAMPMRKELRWAYHVWEPNKSQSENKVSKLHLQLTAGDKQPKGLHCLLESKLNYNTQKSTCSKKSPSTKEFVSTLSFPLLLVFLRLKLMIQRERGRATRSSYLFFNIPSVISKPETECWSNAHLSAKT